MQKKQFTKLQKLLQEYMYSERSIFAYLKDDFTCGFKDEKYRDTTLTDSVVSKIKEDVLRVPKTDFEEVISSMPDSQRDILIGAISSKTVTELRETKGNSYVLATYRIACNKLLLLVDKYKASLNPDSIYNYTDMQTALYFVKRGYTKYSDFLNRYKVMGISGLRDMNGIGEKYLTQKIIPMLRANGVDIPDESLESKRKTISVDLAVKLIIQEYPEFNDKKAYLTEILQKGKLVK